MITFFIKRYQISTPGFAWEDTQETRGAICTAGNYDPSTGDFSGMPSLSWFNVRVCSMPLIPQRWGHTLVTMGGLGGQSPGHSMELAQGLISRRVSDTGHILFLENPILSCQAPLASGFFLSSLHPPFLLPYFPFFPSFHLPSEEQQNTPAPNMPLWYVDYSEL